MAMSTKKTWLLAVLIPLIVVITLDQGLKLWAETSQLDSAWGWFRFILFHNYGFVLGSLKDADQLYTIVMPSTFGAFLLYLYFVLQYFLPIKYPMIRVGLSIFCAGVISNIIDRVMWGYVIDFVQITTPFFRTGIFNLADVLQWVGIGIFAASYIRNGKALYPIDERRGRKWIDPKFQLKFCATLIFVGFAFAVIMMALSYTFLDVSIVSLIPDENTAREFLRNFVRLFAVVSLAFFLSLFVLGVQLSWRIVGPIRAFEGYIEDILRGNSRTFRLRSGDEFQQLEGLASKFHSNFHEALGIDPSALKEDDRAPQFSAVTYKGEEIRTSDYLGKKVWLIFYRYATCPLCAMHMKDIKKSITEILKNGGVVLAVFENDRETFLKESTGVTAQLLQDLSIPLISDPKRNIYRLYRNRISTFALFKLKTIKRLIQASQQQFKQAEIEGKLGTLPAHFLIDEEGRIAKTFYATNMVDHIDLNTARDFFGLPKVPDSQKLS